MQPSLPLEPCIPQSAASGNPNHDPYNTTLTVSTTQPCHHINKEVLYLEITGTVATCIVLNPKCMIPSTGKHMTWYVTLGLSSIVKMQSRCNTGHYFACSCGLISASLKRVMHIRSDATVRLRRTINVDDHLSIRCACRAHSKMWQSTVQHRGVGIQWNYEIFCSPEQHVATKRIKRHDEKSKRIRLKKLRAAVEALKQIYCQDDRRVCL